MRFNPPNNVSSCGVMQISQYINYLSIDLLEKMGNDCPTQNEIDFMESMIKLGMKKYRRQTEKTDCP